MSEVSLPCYDAWPGRICFHAPGFTILAISLITSGLFHLPGLLNDALANTMGRDGVGYAGCSCNVPAYATSLRRIVFLTIPDCQNYPLSITSPPSLSAPTSVRPR
jgi:hypothetical protein